jgi:peptidoglycan/xylan/chitin deacetylase (PgdA/CDA1 family)
MTSLSFNTIRPYKKIPILVYHKIDDIPKAEDKFRLSVSPAVFEKQMEYLSKSKKCLPLEDYVSTLRNGKYVSDNSVVITFDDGYKDNYTNGFPILKKYNLKATFFIAASLVGMTNTWDKSLGEPRADLLSWDEIDSMSKAGMFFGSHGCTHQRLTTCSEELLEQELKASKKILEERLNKRIRLFSYPYGDSNIRATQISKTVGYIAACSDRETAKHKVDFYNLNRISIYSSDSPTLFKIKVSGWYDWIENILTIIKIRGVMRKIKRFRDYTKKTFYATDQT